MRRVAAKVDRISGSCGACGSNSSGSPRMLAMVFAIFVGVMVHSGCQRGENESRAESPHVPPLNSGIASSAQTVAEREVTPPGTPVSHSWFVIQLGGRAVGHSHRAVTLDASSGLQTLAEQTVLRYTRDGNEDEEHWEYYSREKQDGTVVECGWTSKSRHDFQTSRIVVDENTADVESRVSASAPVTRETIEWPPGTRGYFALEQSLKQQPMSAGEVRTIDAVIAGINQLVHFHAKANSPALARLLGDRELELLPVQVEVSTGSGLLLDVTLWADAGGSVLRQEVAQLDQVILLADQATALGSDARFEVGFGAFVPLDGKLPSAEASSPVTYRFTSKTTDLMNMFSSTAWQRVEVLDPQHVRVSVVSRNGEPKWNPLPAPTAEQLEQYLSPTDLAQSDHPEIRKVALSIASDATDPRVVVDALVDEVNRRVKVKDASRSLASALEVLRGGHGDCTEHAVLLAALCRARDISVRGVVGLMVVPNGHELALHMWNEIWLDDAWFPVDATWGANSVGTDRVRLCDISLQYEQFLLTSFGYTRSLRDLRGDCGP